MQAMQRRHQSPFSAAFKGRFLSLVSHAQGVVLERTGEGGGHGKNSIDYLGLPERGYKRWLFCRVLQRLLPRLTYLLSSHLLPDIRLAIFKTAAFQLGARAALVARLIR